MTTDKKLLSARKQSRKCRLPSAKKVPQLHEFLKTKGISVAGYKKNELVKIAEFIFNFKCPTDPDFTGDSTEKVIN